MIYTIKKGNHYSRHWPKLHTGKTRMKIRFAFLKGCWWPTVKPDDAAINKLAGWSFGLHHKNSIRVGWAPSLTKNKIDLYFYLYHNGSRHTRLFATVDCRVYHDLKIEIDGPHMNGLLSFSMRSEEGVTTLASCSYRMPKFKYGYILFPYVGGKLTARADANIDLGFLE